MVGGDERMSEGLAGVRQDLGVSQWLARMMTAFMAEGKLDPHIAMVNEVYRRRRDTAIAAVREHCGDFVRFDVPQGGFYLWLELDEAVDWDQVGPLAAENGVMCRPGGRVIAEGDSRAFSARGRVAALPAAGLQPRPGSGAGPRHRSPRRRDPLRRQGPGGQLTK